MKNSVFYLSYSKRYYLTHPWKFVSHFFRDCRAAWKRAIYGWCAGDVWDWDNWFMLTIPDMFRHMAEHGLAYPGHEPFTTPEKWHDWLHEMANLIETGREDWQDEHNEYYDEYIKHLMDSHKLPVKDENGYHFHTPREFTELDKKYFARANELREQGEKNIRFVLSQIAEHFYDLWD